MFRMLKFVQYIQNIISGTLEFVQYTSEHVQIPWGFCGCSTEFVRTIHTILQFVCTLELILPYPGTWHFQFFTTPPLWDYIFPFLSMIIDFYIFYRYLLYYYVPMFQYSIYYIYIEIKDSTKGYKSTGTFELFHIAPSECPIVPRTIPLHSINSYIIQTTQKHPISGFFRTF